MTELWQFGALELAAMIRDGTASSREVVDARLARVPDIRPTLSAVFLGLPATVVVPAAVVDVLPAGTVDA